MADKPKFKKKDKVQPRHPSEGVEIGTITKVHDRNGSFGYDVKWGDGSKSYFGEAGLKSA